MTPARRVPQRRHVRDPNQGPGALELQWAAELKVPATQKTIVLADLEVQVAG
jgi:hypothetical protein